MAWMSARSRQQIFNRLEVEKLQLFGALDHPLQPVEANRRSQIQQGSRQRRDRNPFSERAVLRCKGTGLVESKWRTLSAPRESRDVNGLGIYSGDPRKPSGRVVAQEGTTAAGEHRRQAPPMNRDTLMADCEDAAVEAM